MTSLAIGLVLALVASLALNGSYVIQHVGAVAAPPIDVRRPLATLAGLLRSRVWLAGAALGMTGWAVHVTALAHAPLSLVQAFVAGGLALVAPLAARALGHPMSRGEWTGVAVAVFALALLCVGLRAPDPGGDVPAGSMAAFLAASAAAAAAFTRAGPAWRAHALGLAGGVLYGAADVSIKGLTSVAHAHGAAAVVTSPWLAAAALATAGAFFAFQRGLQTGRPVPTIVLMTAATTVVSILGGIAVFGDSLGASSTLVAVHLAAFVLVTAAAAALAPRAAPTGG